MSALGQCGHGPPYCPMISDAIDPGHIRDRNSRSAAVFGRVLSFGPGPKENRKRFASGYSTTRSGYLAGPLITADKSDNIRTSSWYLSAERGATCSAYPPRSWEDRCRIGSVCYRSERSISTRPRKNPLRMRFSGLERRNGYFV